MSRSVGDFPSGKNLLLKLQAPTRDRQEKILQASLRQSLMFFKEKAPKTCKGPKCLPSPTTRILSEMLSVSQLLRTFIQFAAERPLRSIQNTVAASPRVNKRSSAFDTGSCSGGSEASRGSRLRQPRPTRWCSQADCRDSPPRTGKVVQTALIDLRKKIAEKHRVGPFFPLPSFLFFFLSFRFLSGTYA